MEPVAATADDAILSKLSCVRLKYYADPFLEEIFSKKKNVRRSPIINRGYFVRVASFDRMITDFLALKLCAQNAPKQIISLGAGIDTSFWRLHASNRDLFSQRLRKFVEIDFQETCSRKLMLLTHHSDLFLDESLLGSKPKVDAKRGTLHSDRYALIPGDLTKWTDIIEQLAASDVIRFDVPTLFISECCLIYISWQRSEAILQSAAKSFTHGVAFGIYEQILPNDAFGRQMIKNLAERDLQLMSFHKYPDLKAQQDRFLGNGFHVAVAWDLNRIYRDYLERKDTKRIERLEMFDEFEEWHIFMAHYFISSNVRFPDSVKDTDPPTMAHFKVAKNEEEKAVAAEPEVAAESKEDGQQNVNGKVAVDEDADVEMKDADDNGNDDGDDDGEEIKRNWCRFGFIDQHFNPKPLVIPTRKGNAVIPKKE